MSSFLKRYSDHLVKSLTTKPLAPFYLIQTSPQDHKGEDWFLKIIQSYLEELEGFTSERAQRVFEVGHVDLLVIRKDPKEKQYKVDDPALDEFFKIQRYAPHSFKKRLIILFDAESLSPRINNKMLKTLEEPQVDTSIFFVSKAQEKILPTILSRSIQIRKPFIKEQKAELIGNPENWWQERSNNQESGDFFLEISRFLKEKATLSETIDFVKNKEYLPLLQTQVLNFCAGLSTGYTTKERALEVARNAKLIETFHQAKNRQIHHLLVFLKETMQSP